MPYDFVLSVHISSFLNLSQLKNLYCNYTDASLWRVRCNKGILYYTVYTIHHYSSLPITIHHYIRNKDILSIIYCPSLHITTHHYPSLHITIHDYSSLSITTHYYPSLPMTTHHYTSLSITIHHYTHHYHYRNSICRIILLFPFIFLSF